MPDGVNTPPKKYHVVVTGRFMSLGLQSKLTGNETLFVKGQPFDAIHPLKVGVTPIRLIHGDVMEIGGHDTIIDTDDPHKAAQKIMDWVGWTNAVIEKDEDEDFFYYQDQTAKDAWEEKGLVPALENTMIYFLIHPGQLTVVTDKELTDSIREMYETMP